MKHIILVFLAAAAIIAGGCSGERESADQLTNKAYAAAESGNWKKALEFSKRAVRVEAASVDARIIYALALENDQKPEDALDQISRALSIEPDDAFLLYTKGRLLYQQGRYDSCIEPLRAALKKRPNDPNILVLLAQSARKLNDPSSAMAWYGRLAGMPMFRKNQPIWNELGVSMLLMNRSYAAKAATYFNWAYRLNSANPSTVLNLAILYDRYLTGKKSNAVAFYNYYLRLTAGNNSLAEKRAAVENRLKDLR